MQPVNRPHAAWPSSRRCLKEQYLLVRLDEERAVRAIPRLLPDSEHARRAALDALLQVLAARGALPEEGQRRLAPHRGAVRRSRPRGSGVEGGQCLTTAVRPPRRPHAKYERLIERAAQASADDDGGRPSLRRGLARKRGRGGAARACSQPILVGPPARIARRRGAAPASTSRPSSSSTPAHSHDSAAKAVELVRGGPRRGPDEGQPAHRRADGRRGGARHRHPHRAAHQPLLRHGRAGPSRRR